MQRYCSIAGILTAPWWIITIAIFSYLEPNYSNYYKAISELGAFGAKNWIAMNIICLFMTGVLAVMAGIAFRKLSIKSGNPREASTSVILTGIMLAGTAIPADMELYFKSPWTIAHAFFVMLGVIPFFVATFKTPKALKALGVSSKFINYFPLLIIPTFTLHGFIDQGGLVQRMTILIVLIWLSYLSFLLFKSENLHN